MAQKFNPDTVLLSETLGKEITSEYITDLFTDELIKQGKNPFDGVEVDLESEYLKLHHSEIVQKAVDDALKADKDRRKKADNHAANTPPGKGGDDDTVEEITTVSDLDKYFDSLAL